MLQNWLAENLPIITSWLLAQVMKIASWGGFIIGLALVPVYLFYFLMEKKGISSSWTDYLPLRESKTKEEVVFVLGEINERLITFFRSQVLVAMCVGGLFICMLFFLLFTMNIRVTLGCILNINPLLLRRFRKTRFMC